MVSRPDFVVYSPDHQTQLVVEVNGTPTSDESWAAKLRRNLLVHGAIPETPYFLLVLPDHLYLWKHSERDESALPDYRANTRQVLHRYLGPWSAPNHHAALSGRGLELAVRSWLTDLTSAGAADQENAGETHWLSASGLPDRLRTGRLEAESTP